MPLAGSQAWEVRGLGVCCVTRVSGIEQCYTSDGERLYEV